MTSFSLPANRKVQASIKTSEQEKFYQTRELFKRNRRFISSYMQNQEQEQEMLNPKKYEKKNLQTANNSPTTHNASTVDKSTFDKYFTSSAQKTDYQVEIDFHKTKKRFQPVREIRQQEMISPQHENQSWKNFYPRYPKFDFIKLRQRGSLFPYDDTGDEKRYNNFKVMDLSPHTSMDIQKKRWRNYEVFKSVHMDKSYDNSNNSYMSNIYSQTDYKCLVNMGKEDKLPRKFYQPLHPSQIAATQLDNDQVVRQKDGVTKHFEKKIVKLNKISGREQMVSTLYNQLRADENFYEKKSIVIKECKRCEKNN